MERSSLYKVFLSEIWVGVCSSPPILTPYAPLKLCLAYALPLWPSGHFYFYFYVVYRSSLSNVRSESFFLSCRRYRRLQLKGQRISRALHPCGETHQLNGRLTSSVSRWSQQGGSIRVDPHSPVPFSSSPSPIPLSALSPTLFCHVCPFRSQVLLCLRP